MIEGLLQPAINVGLSEFDFWTMTVAEVERYLQGAVWRHKTQAQFDYTLANVIARNVGCILGGGDILSIEEVYPDLFQKEEPTQEEQIDKQTANSVNNFLEFARKHNSKITKGVEQK